MKSAAPASRPWLFNAPLDLLVGCGAWSLPLLALTFAWQRDPARAATLGLAFYALGIFCNNPHYMATLHRAYHRPGDFGRFRFFTVYVTVLLGLAAVLLHLAPGLAPWIITLYLTWSPWHYTGQNFGIAQLLARRAGAPPDPAARHLLFAGYVAAFVAWAATLHAARPAGDPHFIGLGLPPRLAGAIQLGGALAFVGLSGAAFVRLRRSLPWRALAGPLLLSLTQALWFVLPAVVVRTRGLDLPASYFSAGVLAFMHCAQYLWITTYYARREADVGGTEAAGALVSGDGKNNDASAARPRFSFRRYYALLVVGGIALFVPGPWIASRLFGHDFVESFLIFMALVNLHHFILDGAVWKLRDGRLARLLLGRRDPGDTAAEVSLEAASAGGHHLGWLFGATRAARFTRRGLAALLLALAALDQWQNIAVSRVSSGEDLDRAAAINPDDTRARFRLARQRFAAGDAAAARRELEALVARHPRNAPAQHLLGEVLLRSGDTAAALAHYERMAGFFPADLSVATNLGLLLQNAGRSREAVAQFDLALRLAPSRRELRALRGAALIDAGRDTEGRVELEAFCTAYERDASDPALLDRYLETALRLGRDHFARGDFSAAEPRLRRTADVAATHRRFTTASRALDLLARLQTDQGRAAEAEATRALAAQAAAYAQDAAR